MWGLWRDRDFLKLWVGQTVSDFGDQITLLGLCQLHDDAPQIPDRPSII